MTLAQAAYVARCRARHEPEYRILIHPSVHSTLLVELATKEGRRRTLSIARIAADGEVIDHTP